MSSHSQQVSELAELAESGASGVWKLRPLVSASELAKLETWSTC